MASFHGVAKLPGFRERAMDCKKAEEKDYFREIPTRYLGYANEVGEAFRHMIPLRGVHLSYAISSAYVVSHAASQGLKAHKNCSKSNPFHKQHIPNQQVHELDQKYSNHSSTIAHHRHGNSVNVSPPAAVLDTLVWQGLASVIIPGLAINRLCAVSRFVLNRHARRLMSDQMRNWMVTGIGLGSIPLIIHPIDSAVDTFMDFCVRPLLRT